jgi:hypothetical protein
MSAMPPPTKAEEIEAHTERLEWLLGDRPKWACGESVDLATKTRLIDQSRQILKSHGAPTPPTP